MPVSQVEPLASDAASVHNGFASITQRVSNRSVAKEPEMHLMISKVDTSRTASLVPKPELAKVDRGLAPYGSQFRTGTHLLLPIFLCCCFVLPSRGLAQQNPVGAKGPTANIVRPEYYTASDFFADGQIAQAAIVLEAALSQSRMVNNQRGIDSVPPMVKMGECFWEQCDIGMAMEKFDAAYRFRSCRKDGFRCLNPLRETSAPRLESAKCLGR